ncbi:MAG: permease [Nitrospirae bacterium GWC2_57_13]|nr:MAG: permease [Nitrospirae bacterium GWC2_57_13]OGW45469.1 MAG: permease [Nitrospirae bacterium GWD2_57_8]HAS54366.1 permease [Nitrospiraceae bacterium]
MMHRWLLSAALLFSFVAMPAGVGVAAQNAPAQKPAGAKAGAVTVQIDKTELKNGGTIMITGKAPRGKPVFIEVFAERTVRASRFDADVDKETKKRPYIFYMTHEMPAYYKIFAPKDRKEAIDKEKKEGKKWSVSKVLKDTGADAVYSAPTKIKIDRYQATLVGSIIGSRGSIMPAMDDKDNARRSMQLLKARFRSLDKVLGAAVDVAPDGSFKAEVKIRSGLAPGKYTIVAAVDKATKSAPVTFENKISFPLLYLKNGGTSLNLIGPFLLTLAVAIFGVLMGAGGGFILNPLLVSIWPLPHTIVAGTVMPTVLFSQGSGIYNYSKIKFISWKLGVAIGLSMVVGGFIGPKMTELITLEQFKFVFGWILIILAGLMFWQTTPKYLATNKKEQAILKEFKRKAEESARKK